MENNIYTGTIKKCKNLDEYQTYGEKHYIPDFKMRTIEIGIQKDTVEIIESQAILEKISETEYQWISFDETIDREPIILSTIPKKSGDVFVDPKTLKQYDFENKEFSKEEEQENRNQMQKQVLKNHYCMIEMNEKNKEYNQNEIDINKLIEKNNFLTTHSKEGRMVATTMFSTVIYIILVTSLPVGLENLIGRISTNFISIPLIVTSLGMGIVLEKIKETVIGSKRKLKEFTTAKTEAEKLEQQFKWQIEKEKLTLKNKIIKMYNKKMMINVNNKNSIQNTEKSQNLTEVLAEKYHTLNTIIYKKILTKARDEDPMNSRGSRWYMQGMTGLIMALLYKLPYAWYQGIIPNLPTSPGTITLFSSFLLGVLISEVYCIKKHIDCKKATNNITKELGQNVLSNEKLDEPKYKLEVKIEKLIEEISSIEFQIQEAKINQLIGQEAQQEQSKTITPSIEELKQMKKCMIEEKTTEAEETFHNNEIEKNGRQFTKRK